MPRRSQLLGAAVLAATVGFALARGEFSSFVVGLGFVYLVAVLGLHVLLNDAGQISLAHGAFVAVGAFAAGHVLDGAPGLLVLALPLGAGGGALAGAVVALPVLRLQGFIVAITTWLFAVAADRYLFAQSWFVGGTAGLEVSPPELGPLTLDTARRQLVAVAVVAALAVVVVGAVRRSRFGRSLHAVRSNEAMATSVGVDVRSTKVAAFAVAGGFAGLAGALHVMLLGRAVPSSFPPFLSVTFLAIAIVGGRGGLWGPALAAFLFASAPELFGGIGRTLQYVSALALVVVLVQFPGGVNQQLRSLRSALVR